MPFQAATAVAASGLAYSPQRKLEQLCDGSALLLYQSASSTVALKQITTPGGTPTFTSVAQTFSIAGGSNTIGDLYVLNNGTTTSDVWVTYTDSSTTTGLYVAHGTYTASGATWSWDNTGTSLPIGAFTSGYMLPSLVYTGSNLIVVTRANASNYGVSVAYTATKNGASLWSTLATLDGGNLGSHCFPLVRHDATNACTLIVYALANDTLYARVLADSTTPTATNWQAATRVALTGTINVGAANIAAALDTATKRLHVAYIDATSGVATNPQYVTATYTTTSIGTPSSPLGLDSGASSATGATLALDGASPANVYVAWASGAVGAASDINYVKVASPYTSAGTTTNLTNASANDNAYPHFAVELAQSNGYVPLVYAYATSPYAIEYDNSISGGGGGGAAVTLSTFTSGLSATLAGERYLAGTGIGDLSVTTKTQTWSGGPGGSPGTETDISYQDALGDGWTAGIIPTYGGDTVSSRYERDNGVDGANMTSLATSVPDGALHWYTQSGGGVFAGSEDLPFTLTELAPTNTAYRRYYKGTFGPDANGFHWAVYTCFYPGDPGLWFYRFDCINPSASAITLAGSDGLEMALVGGLEQSDSTWSPANGGYGVVGGANTVGWPSVGTLVDPDYVYITPSAGSGVALGHATVKQAKATTYTPAWATPQLVYLQNTTRLKLKLYGDVASFPASTTSTIYLLSVMRRNLTSADAAAIAADYIAPGTPTTSVGAFTSFSYDEGAYVFSVSGGANALTTTLDFTPANVTVRFKPRFIINGWTGVNPPLVTFGGVQLTSGQDYRYHIDTTNQVLYVQLYWDVVASSAQAGQLNNAALSITTSTVHLPTVSGDLAATLAGNLATPSVALPVFSSALTATLAGTLTTSSIALGAFTSGLTSTLAGTLTPPAVTLSAQSSALSATLAGTLTAPAIALPLASSGLAATLAGTLSAGIALGVFSSGLDATLDGTLSTPALKLPSLASGLTATLAGSLVNAVALPSLASGMSAQLAGNLSAPSVALPSLASMSMSATLAGTLTTAVALASLASGLTATLAGSLSAPSVALPSLASGLSATLAGQLATSDSLPVFSSGLNATLAGDVLTGLALPALASGMSATLAGTLTPPAVTLSATVAQMRAQLDGALTCAVVLASVSVTLTSTLAGTLTPPAIALGATSSRLVASVAGALTSPAVALALTTAALTSTLAGDLATPSVALRALSAGVAATLAGSLSAPSVTIDVFDGGLSATLVGDPTRALMLPTLSGALVVTLAGDAETASTTLTVTGLVFLPNVLLQVERSVYDATTDSTSGYQLYLGDVQAHIEASSARDLVALTDGALTSDYTACVASGAPIVTGDRISTITQLDGVTAWPADVSSNAHEYYAVVLAREDEAYFLPQRRLYLKRMSGGGPTSY